MGFLADQDFEGLLNNLQDWELSFKEKDKKLKSESLGKEKYVSNFSYHVLPIFFSDMKSFHST